VFDDGRRGARLAWTADLLPDTLAPTIEGMMDQRVAAIERAFAAVTQ
jgi:hypothetical protein